ncbi:hypothetical protein B0H10DRAFT_2186338 [Mycena sp. CBHHK59/15]|nr:hypothetical protein B0H10DRAFT_2186338 [Mycena sp. CBHHK59/15]
MAYKIRRAVVFHPGSIAHNHPMPPILKVLHEAKAKYRSCVDAVGCVGATVAKVDNAPSTKLLLDGQTPAEYSTALHTKRIKHDIVAQQKRKVYPAGLGIPVYSGTYQLYLEDLEKPIAEQYSHHFINALNGGLIIFTCFTALLSLLDDGVVEAFEDDTTHKHVAGDLNEWELVIFFKALQRAITLARAYINRASTDFFELLFDTFSEIKIEATGKDLQFQCFVQNGNLLVMNADMEATQALGVVCSILKINQPQFSGITTLDPAIFAMYFIKICCGHSIWSLVSAEDFRRLKDFMFINSAESLKSFMQFVEDLGVKKIHGRLVGAQGDERLDCAVSGKIPLAFPDHWDRTPATTNMGEVQHHWTNSLTGIQLSPVEVIESARRVDQGVVNEVQASMITGVLSNCNNEMFHRMSQNGNANLRLRLKAKISDQKVFRRQSSAMEKALQAEFNTVTGATTSGRSKQVKSTSYESVVVSASSSGGVKTDGSCSKASESGTVLSESPQSAESLIPSISQSALAAPSDTAHLLPASDLAPFNFGFDITQFKFSMFDNPPAPESVQTPPPLDFSMNQNIGNTTTDFRVDLSAFTTDWQSVMEAAPASTGVPFDLSAFTMDQTITNDAPTFTGTTLGFGNLFAATDLAANGSSAVEYNLNWNALTPPNELPTLPAPPAPSPPFAPEVPEPSLEPTDISVKSKGKMDGLDEGNILHTQCNRIRRTRSSDNKIPAPASKKKRTAQ